MNFTKMHGAGNDYIYVDCTKINLITDPEACALKWSGRHFGIGSDGLVLIQSSNTCDFKMSMYNSDGSQAQMCGNAVRCVGKFVYEKNLTDKNVLTVETLAGVKILTLNIENGIVKSVRVDMGEPKIIDESCIVKVAGKSYDLCCVSMGNPHAVLFVDKATDELVHGVGPLIEVASQFPERTNVEFATPVDANTIKMRVWERGAGETLACGTGACATLVAAALKGLTSRKATLKLLGGDLEIEWAQDNHVYMTGPAEFVFEGEIDG